MLLPEKVGPEFELILLNLLVRNQGELLVLDLNVDQEETSFIKNQLNYLEI